MRTLCLSTALLALTGAMVQAADKPNIIIIFADDISAREFPIYNSTQWTDLHGKSTQDPTCRASTPVIDRLAQEGCWFQTSWTATVSSPARAQLMTGRFAHQHKWWHNGDKGTYLNQQNKEETWPLFESSPLQMAKLAQQGGYATYWAEKTQMPYEERADLYGFDEMCITPGSVSSKNLKPITDFDMVRLGKSYTGLYRVKDSGREIETYHQLSYYWQPGVALVNDPTCPKKNTTFSWPNTPESRRDYGVETFGPDVAQEHTLDFMERKHQEGKPFLIYHTTHLGHGAYNFLSPDTDCQYPQTPKVEWRNGKYVRTPTKITGDKGVYDFHGTLSGVGIHNHINYIDYMVWRYLEKCKEMGVMENTIFIIAADNGTSKYGKGVVERQRGVHTPLIVYAPVLNQVKKGKQLAMSNIADILPTVAEIAGVDIPKNYSIDGKSLVPFLTTNQQQHRDFVYSYRSGMQLIRGKYVMKDGNDDWYDVSKEPGDYDSYDLIEDWSMVSPAHRAEKKKLQAILPQYDLYISHRNGPGGTSLPKSKKALAGAKKPKSKMKAQKKQVKL